MFITEPKIAVDLFNDESSQFLKRSRKEHKEDTLKLYKQDIKLDNIKEAVIFIKNNFDILLSNEEFIEITNLYPYKKAYLVESDFNNSSETKEAVSDMICNFFADTKMITYGDTNNNETLQAEFLDMIKELAEEFGYKTSTDKGEHMYAVQ